MNPTNVCKVINEHGVIRGSTIKVSEGLRPKRIVLRHLEHRNEFVVHTEYLAISVGEQDVGPFGRGPVAIFTSEAFDQGDYFGYGEHYGRTKEEAHKRATERFQERSKGYGY